jgi:hypothetical protein
MTKPEEIKANRFYAIISHDDTIGVNLANGDGVPAVFFDRKTAMKFKNRWGGKIIPVLIKPIKK